MRGEARSAKKDVDEVMRDLSRVVSGRADRDVFMEMRVEEITPVLQNECQDEYHAINELGIGESARGICKEGREESFKKAYS